VRDVEPPGWTRNTPGNPYFEHPTWWEAKCRRCREKTVETYQPWYKVLWYSLRGGWWHATQGIQYWWPWQAATKAVAGKDYRVSSIRSFLYALLGAPFGFAGNMLVHWWGEPKGGRLPISWLMGLCLDMDYWCMGRSEYQTVYMRWETDRWVATHWTEQGYRPIE
jgi:hypothetical protein